MVRRRGTARLVFACGLTMALGVAFTGAAPFQDAPAAAQPQDEAKAEGATPATTAAVGDAKPFALTIPGTTVVLDMLPVRIATGDGATTTTIWVAKTETTWDLYDAFVMAQDKPAGDRAAAVDAVARPTKAYVLADRGFGHAGFPALSISAKGAQQCCAWLSALSGVTFRLPTETEWEAAARAGDESAAPAALDDVAWHLGNDDKKTRAVATKAANAFGLHDMLGNVAEWCTTADGKTVLRGGCFLDKPEVLTYAARREPVKAWNQSDPQIPKSKWWLADAAFAGFRVVCDSAPSP